MIRITIWSNCQLIYLKNIFEDYVSKLSKIYGDSIYGECNEHISSFQQDVHDYQVTTYLNYELMKNNNDIPDSFYECDILISQNTNLPGKYNIEEIKKKLHKKVKIIMVPFIIFTGYWPGEKICGEIPINNCHIHKFGLWPTPVKIPTTKLALREVEKSLDILKKREFESDIQGISDYIRNNYKKQRLFYNHQHPTEHLLHLMYEQIWDIVHLNLRSGCLRVQDSPAFRSATSGQLDTYTSPKYDCIELNTGFKDYIMPIDEEVSRELNIEFDINGYNIYYPDLQDYESWYIQQLEDYGGNSQICKFCYKSIV